MDVLTLIVASVALLVGLRLALRGPRFLEAGDSRGTVFLVAVHYSAGAGFWLSLGGIFLVFVLAVDPIRWRWLALIPIVLAGVRMLAAFALSRR